MTAAETVATTYPSGPELAIAAAWLAYAVWMARKMLRSTVTPTADAQEGQR